MRNWAPSMVTAVDRFGSPASTTIESDDATTASRNRNVTSSLLLVERAGLLTRLRRPQFEQPDRGGSQLLDQPTAGRKGGGSDGGQVTLSVQADNLAVRRPLPRQARRADGERDRRAVVLAQ